MIISSLNTLINLFQTVLVMSAGATVILLFILIIRTLAGRRMSLRSQALIWLFFLSALVIPFTQIAAHLPAWPNPAAQIWEPVGRIAAPLAAKPIPDHADYATADPSALTSQSASESQPERNPADRPWLRLDPVQAIWLTAGIVWLLGLLSLLTVYIYSYLKTRRMIHDLGQTAPPAWQTRIAELAGRAGVRRTPRLILFDGAHSPFVMGIRHNQLILPSGMIGQLDDRAIDTILAHELVHLRHRDHWLRLLQCLLQSLHWFNPFCWAAFRWHQRDCEYYCDESTIHLLRTGNRSEYAQVLLTTAALPEPPAAQPTLPATMLPASFLEINLHQRIREILSERQVSSIVALTAVMTIILAGCVLLPGSNGTDSNATSGSTVQPATAAPTSAVTPSPVPSEPTTTASSDGREKLSQMAAGLEEIIKRGDAQALIPYIANGRISDPAVLARKAAQIIDTYKRYVAPTGENHLEPYISPYDTSGIYSMISWEGDIKSSDWYGQDVGRYAVDYAADQLKIKVLPGFADYLPAHRIENQGLVLGLDIVYSLSDLRNFFSGGCVKSFSHI